MKKQIVFCLALLMLCMTGCVRPSETDVAMSPAPTPGLLYFTEDDTLGQMQLLRIDGVLYYNTNLRTEAQYGYPDATIASSRYPGNVPDKDNQSNFGAGYEYYIGEQGLTVCIDGTWWQFAPLTASPIWGLKMDIGNVTTKGADITVTRYESDVTAAITAYPAIALERWTENGWEPADGLVHIMDMDWGSQRWTLRTGDTLTWSVDWSAFYGELAMGSYRLSKQFKYYAADGMEHSGSVCVQFDVKEDTPAEPVQSNRWGVGMTAENVTADGLTLTITRSDRSDWEIITGDAYTLETMTAGTWVAYERNDGLMIDFAWNSIGYLVTADAPLTMSVDWSWLHGTVPAGRYRLVKELIASQPSDRDPPRDVFTAYVEFEIKD